jgi:hypothetical protein
VSSPPLNQVPAIVGISALLPASGLLKRLAGLFDIIVCDNLSIHVVTGASEEMRERSPAEWNVAYEARVRELHWLRDAGVLSPLADFAKEHGISSKLLDEIRRISQEATAPLAHAELHQAAISFASGYERVLAAKLLSHGIVAISVSPVTHYGENAEADVSPKSGLVELVFSGMPSIDVLTPWEKILRLRQDPDLATTQNALWRFLQNITSYPYKDIDRAVESWVGRYRALLEVHSIRPIDEEVQAIVFAPLTVTPARGSMDAVCLTITNRGHQGIWHTLFPSPTLISCGFPDTEVLTDAQNEVLLSSFEFHTMISLPDTTCRAAFEGQ